MISFILIRHGQSILNRELIPQEWDISIEGISQSRNLAKFTTEIQNIDIFYSSYEKKAIKTAEIIIHELNNFGQDVKLIKDSRLNEVERSKGIFFETQELFNETVKNTFSNLNSTINNWETSKEALSRFNSFYDEINLKYKDKDITIGLVTHGTIMSLFLANKGNYLDDLEKIFDLWSKMPFNGWAILKDNQIEISWS